MSTRSNRRTFLKVGAGAAGGLLVGFYLPEKSKLAAQSARQLRMKVGKRFRIGRHALVPLRFGLRAALDQTAVAKKM